MKGNQPVWDGKTLKYSAEATESPPDRNLPEKRVWIMPPVSTFLSTVGKKNRKVPSAFLLYMENSRNDSNGGRKKRSRAALFSLNL